MPKILFLTDSFANGGAERQLALLVKYLPPEWERCVFGFRDGAFTAVIRESGIPVCVCERRSRYDLQPIRQLVTLLRQYHPAIVHSWGWLSSAIAAPLCRLFHIPLVDGSIRVGWVGHEHVLRGHISLALANRVIANSQAGLDAWGVSPQKGRVIYNGIDPERSSGLSGVKLAGGAFTVVMAARMSPAKDFDTLIEAARLITTRSPEESWRFLLLGEGPSKSVLIVNAADLIQKGVVCFADAGLEVYPFLMTADVGVLMTNPSRLAEGCSNSILEYMVWGLPVVCSDSGGNCEVVMDGKTGFIVPVMDAQALAEKILWLREHPQEAASMGKSGAERIQEAFTAQKMVQKTIDIYQELLH